MKRRPPQKPVKAEKALELADSTAERLVDKSIPVEEQQRRKRALIKGPKEFRDIRKDVRARDCWRVTVAV